MSFLDVDALQQQESERIKIGVDTGAGKTAWPQSVTYGKKLLDHVDLTFRTATGELVKGGSGLRRSRIQSQDSRCSSAGL